MNNELTFKVAPYDAVNRGGQAIHQQLGLTPTPKVKQDLIN
ncbi:hypothetical protein [Paenibacillus taiwanensis]|nr:hypothetical protein [Paenibacillus taiwanensis]